MLPTLPAFTDLALEPTDPLIGSAIGPYQILERIGLGAMGAVYRARRIETGGEVAIKVLLTSEANRELFVKRMNREAMAAARIDHRNIVKVLDASLAADSTPYLVMELVEGLTLAELLLAQHRLAPMRAAHLIKEIAAGLGAAHAAGFVHRDLKPANVMIVGDGEDESVKILDFGIVGLVDSSEQTLLTQEGLMLGTPAYMAPEQVTGPQVTHSADLYALGVILYEMLAGHQPFQGSIREVIGMQVIAEPERLAPAGGLELLAHALLAKDPAQRPASSAAVIAEIDRLLPSLAGLPPSSAPTLILKTCVDPADAPALRRPAPVQRAVRRWPVRVATFAMGCVLGAFAAQQLLPPYEGAVEAALIREAPPLRTLPEARAVVMASALERDPRPVLIRPAPPPAASPRKAPRLSALELARSKLRGVSRSLAASAAYLSASELKLIEERYLDLSALTEPGLEDSTYRTIAAQADALQQRLSLARRKDGA